MKPVFLLLPLLLLAGCKKDPPPCSTVTDVPPAFLAYWYFPKDSWWVYQLKDAVPAVYDTVRVLGTGRGYNERGQGGGGIECVWTYGLGLEHSNATYFPGVPGKKGSERLTSEPAGNGQWAMAQNSDAGFNSPEQCFIYPFFVGREGASNWYITADTAQITTPAGTFAQTVHTVVDTTQIPAIQTYSFIRHFWRTRGVGLTKIAFATYPSTTIRSGTTWELVNYHIVP